MNFATPIQQHSLPSDLWVGQTTTALPSNHLHMQPQHPQTHTTMHNMPSMTLQHPQSINNK